MLLKRTVLIGAAIQPKVGGHSGTAEIDSYSGAGESYIHFRGKLTVPQRSKDPSGDNADGALHERFVLRCPWTGRDNCGRNAPPFPGRLCSGGQKPTEPEIVLQ